MSLCNLNLLWSRFLASGGKESKCGWLVDKFGLSWQIVPAQLLELMSDPDPVKANRVVQCMLGMQKINIAAPPRNLRLVRGAALKPKME